jgi:hypothetical protein
MRREVLRADDVSADDGHTIYFQISNETGRFACSVSVDAPTKDHASQLVSHNWPHVEQVARECVSEPSFGGGEIKLRMERPASA